MNDIKQILQDIAESWGFDSFAEYVNSGLTVEQIEQISFDAIEIYVSQNHLST